MTSILAIDIGSEFADLALRDENGIRVCKCAIGGLAPQVAAEAAIQAAIAELQLDPIRLDETRIGSTGGINALLSRQGTRVAVITTAGFADTLALGRQNRRDLYDPVAVPATPDFLVAPGDIFELSGRIAVDGTEVQVLDGDALSALAASLADGSYDAVAVALLFSHVNPKHERACKVALTQVLPPSAPVVLSHEVDPNPREFERTVSTCAEAWLRPVMRRAMDAFAETLSRAGFSGRLWFADATGRMLEASAAANRAISLLAGGPAAAVTHAAHLVAQADPEPRGAALGVDIGSTTMDITLIRDGAPVLVRQADYGLVPLRQPMVTVVSTPFGGRSRAWVDAIGGIAIGQSDAPDGVSGPSLTECLAALGLIATGPADLTSLDSLAEALGKSREAAAQIVVEVATRRVAAEILRTAAQQNIDPSRLTLVPMGGLGLTLAAPAASILGITRLVVPAIPGLSGALGLLYMDQNRSARVSVDRPLAELNSETLDRIGQTLRASLPEPADGLGERFTIEMAPTPQMHPFDLHLSALPTDPEAFAQAFGEQYHRRYGIRPPGQGFVFAVTLAHERSEGAFPSLPPNPVEPPLLPGWRISRHSAGALIMEPEVQ